MRVLSCMIALAFVLASPTLAGTADRDLPGIGTFAYCGSPVATSLPGPVAAIGQ